MAVNSKRKGKNGELELSRKLREYGFRARRGQQFSGANGDADVVGLPGIHIEVKRVEALNIERAMSQSKSDAREGEMPAVMHRKNHGEWLVTMRLNDWIEIYKESGLIEEDKQNADPNIDKAAGENQEGNSR